MSGYEDNDDKLRRKTKRKALRSSPNGRNGALFLPAGVTCEPSPGMLEMGILLSAVVILLYFFGIYETARELPETPGFPNWLAHMGQNLNVAHLEWTEAAATGGGGNGGPAADSPLRKLGSGNSGSSSSIPMTVPAARWPVTLGTEKENYEDIVHPGDLKTVMSVPKFWSPPVHNKEFFSREKAMQIGSCAQPDASGNYNRGDQCPAKDRTIFVAIASYRDFECRSTVESIFLRAQYPERIRVVVVDQIDVPSNDPICNAPLEPCDKHPEQALCKYQHLVDVYQTEAKLSIGPVFARHLGDRMYRGEYYATQSDAHVTYVKGWDTDIIDQMEATHNEMAVLTTYLTDVQGSITPDGISLRKSRPVMCNTDYEGGIQGMHLRHGSQPEARPSIHGTPQLEPWWAAGYSFSRGHFIVNVPYDMYQPMIFQGEEMSIGLRAWTVGYDFYAPERSVCFHHYATGENTDVRAKVPHFWENDARYKGTGRKAMQRLLGIVHMNPEVDPQSWSHVDEDLYGLGGVRTPEQFYKLYGIDVVNKKVERHLCAFVDRGVGKMHKMFTPHLRSDGMGIDYDQIHYEFKDPEPGEKKPLLF